MKLTSNVCSEKRKKMHPVIRMEDVLNPGRSSTLGNIVRDIANQVSDQDDDSCSGVWYSIPVALNRDSHLQSKQQWSSLLQRIQEQIGMHSTERCPCCCRAKDASCGCGSSSSSIKDGCAWHADLFPASKRFVVYHVLKRDSSWRNLDEINNHRYESRWEGDDLLPKVRSVQ